MREKLQEIIAPDGKFRVTDHVWALWNDPTSKGEHHRRLWCERVGASVEEAISKVPPSGVPLKQPPLPPILKQGANFLKAAAAHMLGGMRRVPIEEEQRRHAICRSCPNYRLYDDRCSECGCFLLGSKVAWAEQRCPLDPPKWSEYVT